VPCTGGWNWPGCAYGWLGGVKPMVTHQGGVEYWHAQQLQLESLIELRSLFYDDFDIEVA
jgi:hypothetical protein